MLLIALFMYLGVVATKNTAGTAVTEDIIYS